MQQIRDVAVRGLEQVAVRAALQRGGQGVPSSLTVSVSTRAAGAALAQAPHHVQPRNARKWGSAGSRRPAARPRAAAPRRRSAGAAG